MVPGFNEWRILHALALTALVLAGAWRCAGRSSGDGAGPFRRGLDALLLAMLAQYVAVTAPGLAGLLNAWTMTATGVLLAALMGWIGRRPGGRRTEAGSAGAPFLCAAFLAGYLGAVLEFNFLNSAVSDDALTYHLPAAVTWLRTGSLSLHETWYFNPANTYSPLAGSSLIAWWHAPMGSDLLARFAQVEGWALVWLAVGHLATRLGANGAAAALVATAAVLCRPIVSQVILTKDDLFLAGAFVAAAGALTPQDEPDAFQPVRLGAALGLMLATKVTALLALPMLLVGADAPWRIRGGWKRYGVALAIAAAIAGPWYLRNALLFGNPLFPVEVRLGGATLLPGMFRAARSEELTSLSSVWRVLVTSYYGLTTPHAVTLPLAWLAAVALAGRRAWADPLARVTLLGPPVGIALFISLAPFAEVRFIYPALLLLFASAAGLAARLASMRWVRHAGLAIPAVLLALSLLTGFVPYATLAGVPGGDEVKLVNVRFILAGLAAAGVAWAAARARARLGPIRPRIWAAWGAGAGLALLAVLYVFADAVVLRYARDAEAAWADRAAYGPDLAEAWAYVRNELPADATVAYANTYLVYPLMGFGGSRNVVYAPVRPGVTGLADLPRLSEAPVPGEKLRPRVAAAMNAGADQATWRENLRRLGARYVLVVTGGHGATREPPELRLARELGFEELAPLPEDRRQRGERNPAAAVFRVR